MSWVPCNWSLPFHATAKLRNDFHLSGYPRRSPKTFDELESEHTYFLVLVSFLIGIFFIFVQHVELRTYSLPNDYAIFVEATSRSRQHRL